MPKRAKSSETSDAWACLPRAFHGFSKRDEIRRGASRDRRGVGPCGCALHAGRSAGHPAIWGVSERVCVHYLQGAAQVIRMGGEESMCVCYAQGAAQVIPPFRRVASHLHHCLLELKRPRTEQEVDDVPFVGLKPV